MISISFNLDASVQVTMKGMKSMKMKEVHVLTWLGLVRRMGAP